MHTDGGLQLKKNKDQTQGKFWNSWSVCIYIYIYTVSHESSEILSYMGKQYQTLFFWAPKSLQMVTAAVKLKDAYPLEGKL